MMQCRRSHDEWERRQTEHPARLSKIRLIERQRGPRRQAGAPGRIPAQACQDRLRRLTAARPPEQALGRGLICNLHIFLPIYWTTAHGPLLMCNTLKDRFDCAAV